MTTVVIYNLMTIEPAAAVDNGLPVGSVGLISLGSSVWAHQSSIFDWFANAKPFRSVEFTLTPRLAKYV